MVLQKRSGIPAKPLHYQEFISKAPQPELIYTTPYYCWYNMNTNIMQIVINWNLSQISRALSIIGKSKKKLLFNQLLLEWSQRFEAYIMRI